MNCYGFFIVLKQIKREYSLINLQFQRITQNRLMKQLYNNLYHHDILPFLTLFIAT